MSRHSENCDDFCISGDQLKAGLEAMGLWFDGKILSVKIGGRDEPMTGHRSGWYALVEVHNGTSHVLPKQPYETRLIRIPVHTGPPESDRADEGS